MLILVLHGIRFTHAGGLWRDEAAALQLAKMDSWHEIWQNFQFEAFPLLFPATVRTFSQIFGTSDIACRAFGFVIGAGIVAVLWLNATWQGHKVPLISMGLLGFNPAFIAIGDSVRGYGLGTLLMLLTFALSAKLVGAIPERSAGLPRRRSILWFSLLTLSSFAAVHCLLYNSILLFALCVSGALAWLIRTRCTDRLPDSRVDKPVYAPNYLAPIVFIGILLLSALSQLPYAKPFLSGREWNMLVKYPLDFGRIWSAFSETIGQPWPWMAFIWLALLLLALCVAGPKTSISPIAAFCLSTLCLSIICYYIFVKILSYLPGPRNFFALIALLALITETILENVCTRALVRLARFAIAGMLALTLFWPAANKLRHRQTNVDLVAQKLSTVDARDLIIVLPWFNGVSFNWYYHGQAAWTTLPAIADHRTHRYDLLKARMASDNPIADVLARAGQTLQTGHAVWIVGNLAAPEQGQLPPILPPAPGSQWGWSDAPYDASWALQLGYFLQTRALNSETVDLPAPGRPSEMENLSLTKVAGWR